MSTVSIKVGDELARLTAAEELELITRRFELELTGERGLWFVRKGSMQCLHLVNDVACFITLQSAMARASMFTELKYKRVLPRVVYALNGSEDCCEDVQCAFFSEGRLVLFTLQGEE
jgi:hypothetical protein